jgi:hypothetical protein
MILTATIGSFVKNVEMLNFSTTGEMDFAKTVMIKNKINHEGGNETAY